MREYDSFLVSINAATATCLESIQQENESNDNLASGCAIVPCMSGRTAKRVFAIPAWNEFQPEFVEFQPEFAAKLNDLEIQRFSKVCS